MHCSGFLKDHLLCAIQVNHPLWMTSALYVRLYAGKSLRLFAWLKLLMKLLSRTTEMQRSDGGTGMHIHACIGNQLRQDAQKMADRQYTPTKCLWYRCSRPNTLWKSRKEFLTHLRQHLNSLTSGKTLACLWLTGDKEEDMQCEEEDCDDWDRHFAEVHAINTLIRIPVQYCIICAQW